ncbi:MAG: hypothetical protein BalsKO_26570 [Balneolaceae bacterium]
MLRFFRQIRKKLMEQNKVRSYFFYALGEIALVMIGILLALQVNNWNNKRLDTIASGDYERRIILDLEGEKLLLNETMEYTRIVTEYAFSAIEIFEKGEIPNAASQDQFLIALYQASQITDPDQIKSTYQELRSSGQINKIRHENIRTMLISYFDYDWTNSTVMVARSPYRESIRQEMPIKIQAKIREECGDQYSGLSVMLSEECDITFDKNLARNAVIDIINNENLKKDLRFRIGNLDSQVLLINSQLVVLDEIITALESVN